uniref:Resolvase n=1 Tax=Marseillevirus LCMAC201 TaxID=2506605 RepID=A0A481YW11_9VIRU|nr:MAG: resolvase [Marseillevirus LCMAC201]
MEIDQPLVNYEVINCILCGSGEDDNVLLLCDGCDKGFHTYCLNLPAIPVGEWYCPGCRRTLPATNNNTLLRVIPVAQGQVYPGLAIFFYERVSSKGQNEPEYGRVGMDTQNNALLEFALKNGLVVRGTAREVHSARNPSQLAELNKICRSIKKGQCVVVYSVSRFSRNLQQGRDMVETIHNKGGWVYSVTDHVSSYEEHFLKLLEEAQAESDRLSQKIRDAYARIRRHGGHIGPPPFGWTTYHDNTGIRRLTPDSEEQKVLVKLRHMYDRAQDAAQTAALLNNAGILRRGKQWTRNQITKSLGSLANNTFSADLRSTLDEME